MIDIEIHSRIENLGLFPDLLGNRFVNKSDFVFVAIDDKPRDGQSYRRRYAIAPGKLDAKKLKPRKLRAEIVRSALQLARRRGDQWSHKQIDDAYLLVLKRDGGTNLALRRAAMYALGFMTKLWFYSKVPPCPKPVSPPASSLEPSSSSPSGATETPPSPQ